MCVCPLMASHNSYLIGRVWFPPSYSYLNAMKNIFFQRFHWPRRVIVADKKPVVVKRQTVIKPQNIVGVHFTWRCLVNLVPNYCLVVKQMLELELNEIKKDDITLQSILNGLKETKINTSIGRLALSKNVCRFELPMDIKMLECELLDFCF
jgi:hypothetical protein